MHLKSLCRPVVDFYMVQHQKKVVVDQLHCLELHLLLKAVTLFKQDSAVRLLVQYLKLGVASLLAKLHNLEEEHLCLVPVLQVV